MPADLEKARREQARWEILNVLNIGRPRPVAETLLFSCLEDMGLAASPNEVRRELDYLDERGLVNVVRQDTPIWLAKLTRLGIDLVEYTIPCDSGIARPPRYS